MANWEYKVITSGKGGFASPALLEKFLNDLGRDEWEIVEFRSSPDNALAFTGLARRSTQRDWTLEDAAAAAAKAEAEKLRAEFAAKFQSATASAPVEERASSFLEEKTAPDDGFRKPVDTSRDSEPDAPDEEAGDKDEWDQLAAQDELPTFFDALKPHMRRNQRGPGQSVGIDYLAKKWGLAEEDVKGALVECGLQIPADENAKPVYVEFEGDLFWVNINRRGEVWINTREKPRPVFRVVQATKVEPTEEEKPENGGHKPEARGQKSEGRGGRPEGKHEKTEAVRHSADETSAQQPEVPPPADSGTTGAALPEGVALLAKIKPLMRRNRRGPGGSGSGSFLARALKCSEADLKNAFATLGLKLPDAPNDKPIEVEISNEIWWLNQDSRGGLWINGREKRASDAAKPAATETPATESKPAESALSDATPAEAPLAKAESVSSASTAPASSSEAVTPAMPIESGAATEVSKSETGAESAKVLSQIRPLLQETKTGSFAGKLDRVASELNRPVDDLTSALVAAGLKVPEKAREKPAFVEEAGEIFWFNLNAKGELWVNAKPSKFADKAEGESSDSGEKKPRRGGRGRGRAPKGEAESAATEDGGTATDTPVSS
jgi:hypothetical protein